MATSKNTTNWYNMSDPAIVSQLGIFLRQIRLQQNLTQEEVAEKAGLSRSAISDIENGKTVASMLDNWQVTSQVSPLQMAKLSGKERLRASGTTTKKEDSEW
jgi:DNA-binding XRE family transcriptional regulator